MTRHGRHRWAFMERFAIGDDDGVHLDRLRIIQTPLVSLYLHHIPLPDPQRAVHNHPWPFLTLVLRGGYEETYSPYPHVHPGLDRVTRKWGRWSVHRMGAASAHRIDRTEPNTLTLVLVGRPTGRKWGFFDGHKFTPYDEYPDTLRVLTRQRASDTPRAKANP